MEMEGALVILEVDVPVEAMMVQDSVRQRVVDAKGVGLVALLAEA